jgi:hypothetical protein
MVVRGSDFGTYLLADRLLPFSTQRGGDLMGQCLIELDLLTAMRASDDWPRGLCWHTGLRHEM